MSKWKKRKNRPVKKAKIIPASMPSGAAQDQNPTQTETAQKPNQGTFDWIKKHKVTVFLTGLLTFSFGGPLNFFGSSPKIFYFPAVVVCILFCWVVMSGTHKFVRSQLSETVVPVRNDSHPLPAVPVEPALPSPRASPDNIVTKEDLLAFSAQVQKTVSALKQDGTNLPGDDLPGFSSQYLLRLGKPVIGRNSFIFDAGEKAEKNRFSIFIDGDENLCCRVIDKDSKSTEVKVAPGLDTFLFGNVMYLVCEYGSTDDFSCVRIIINGKQVAGTNQTVPILISQPVISYGTFMGADMNGTNGAVFFALLSAASHKTWSHADLEPMMKIVYEFKIDPNKGIGGGVSFNGTGYGSTAPTNPN